MKRRKGLKAEEAGHRVYAANSGLGRGKIRCWGHVGRVGGAQWVALDLKGSGKAESASRGSRER